MPYPRAIVSSSILGFLLGAGTPALGQNQAESLSPLIQRDVPFRLRIEQVRWDGDPLPAIHSAAHAMAGDRLLFIGGKTSGLHNFECDPDENFPAKTFNRELIVVDLATRETFTRPLDGDSTGLSEAEIATLSSINTLSEQSDGRLVCVGGYGIDEEGDYVTFASLRVIDVAGAIDWVLGDAAPLSEHVRFHAPPRGAPSDFFTICGGILIKRGDEFWSCLGHDFQGGYSECGPIGTTQVYTKSIRRFSLDQSLPGSPPIYIGETADPPAWARRRDLNVLPAVVPGGLGAVALGGVFTLDDGIWTTPIVVAPDGGMTMRNPDARGSLRQGFNVYESARLSFWSESRGENWFVAFGGLGFQVLWEGQLIENTTVPYSNEVLAVRYAPGSDQWSQHLIGTSFPITTDAAENVYYHGTETITFPLVGRDDDQIDLDALTEETTIAYLYGGIIAGGQGVVSFPDTFASNALFQVVFEPGAGCPADFDGSGEVGAADLASLLEAWNQAADGAPQDLNGDGIVNSRDLGALIAAWGPCSG
ncbi:MAG: hypothetical protein GY895_19140 [Phycisphaera sp.]|nr:hypothetical protein [Phycisphaera sp.]